MSPARADHFRRRPGARSALARMSCGAIWLPFLSTRADDDDAPASFQAMRPDPPPASPAPAAKSAPAEAAPSSPVAIPPLEPRLRIHYDGPLRWNDHPKLTQRVEDATAALEAAGWTSVLQHMPKGVRTPEGVFHFMPTLHAVMNVSGVSRVQLANRLALKRSKQRRALPYPFGAGVSDPVSDPTPDPSPNEALSAAEHAPAALVRPRPPNPA